MKAPKPESNYEFLVIVGVGIVISLFIDNIIKKQGIVDCYKWQSYEQEYVGFELAKDMEMYCKEIGIDIFQK